MYRVAVLVSGSGTNLQALIDAAARGTINCRIVKVISDRSGAYALERARSAGIPAEVVSRSKHGGSLSDHILAALPPGVDIIVLAGFLSILRGDILERFRGRIINIHPALLPEFGGAGMYGIHVHRAVLASGRRETGCSVHIVDEGTDTGPVLVQSRVPVEDGDTPESLAGRVQSVEHETLVSGLRTLAARLGLTGDAAPDARSGEQHTQGERT
ncbi:MAG: phosphoribosylglycinamide formyltransferase [Spirochaetia bacterium]